MYHIRGASTVCCTIRVIGTCCIHHLIKNCTRENPTVFFLDRLPTLDCCCQRRRSDHSFHGLNAVSELRSRSRLPSPTRWNASSCIIECDHNFARLRIDHLDYLEYCSFFTIFASVSSYDAACSCSASFQLVTRLRNLRSVMRFFLSFPPAVGCALFSPAVGYALSCGLRPPSISDPRLHLVVHLKISSAPRSRKLLEVNRFLLPLLVDGHKSAFTSFSVLPQPPASDMRTS